jgi:hypothetical protein
MDSYFIGIATLMAYHSWHRFYTQIMLACHALMAMHATDGIPADTQGKRIKIFSQTEP